jgi:hypothetical protein
MNNCLTKPYSNTCNKNHHYPNYCDCIKYVDCSMCYTKHVSHCIVEDLCSNCRSVGIAHTLIEVHKRKVDNYVNSIKDDIEKDKQLIISIYQYEKETP